MPNALNGADLSYVISLEEMTKLRCEPKQGVVYKAYDNTLTGLRGGGM